MWAARHLYCKECLLFSEVGVIEPPNLQTEDAVSSLSMRFCLTLDTPPVNKDLSRESRRPTIKPMMIPSGESDIPAQKQLAPKQQFPATILPPATKVHSWKGSQLVSGSATSYRTQVSITSHRTLAGSWNHIPHSKPRESAPGPRERLKQLHSPPT